MEDLEKVVQRWQEVRNKKQQEDGTKEAVNKILDTAARMLKEVLSKGVYDCLLKICYWHDNFEVEISEKEGGFEESSGDKDDVKKEMIPFTESEQIEVILKKIIEKFQSFPQINVTTNPFVHQSCIYDIEYTIIISLK